MRNEETIFAEALRRGSPAERDAYLDRACGGDDRLRSQVDALLHAHDQARGILDDSPPGLTATTDQPASPSLVGSAVGPYKLLEQIGGGGMGVVYMAEQLRPIRRKVAVKIIKPGMDSGQVIARFEAERQALTMMDHPNIAKVLDAGTTDAGRPYFVMELVKGVPITDYCDGARLDTRERLKLFVEVCQAVQHAHQKGVIHRDLKPSNILVTLHDDKPVPKVIDFGIAKAAGQVLTDKTLFTNYAQMLGTPLYMSPEQAQISGIDVDTRSDVYSLGVLLYELLTGTTPFDRQRLREAAYDEMRRIIREEEPPNPSTRLSTMGDRIASVSAMRHTEPRKLGQIVRGELDWIAMRALEKDRARRYETAIGLGRDVERYLADEAVQACPPGAAYRFRKFARRNKATLLAASLVASALVLGIVISTWQALRAHKAEGLVQVRLLAEESARAAAVAEAAKANAISALLTEMLETASPNPKAGQEYSVRQLLDDFSTRLGGQLKDQPETEIAIRTTIANTYRQLALPKQAKPHFEAAINLRRLSGGDDLALGDLVMNYAWAVRMDGDAAGAERLARQALAVFLKHDDAKRVLSAYSGLLQFLIKQSNYAEGEAVGQDALAFATRHHREALTGGILQALSTVKRVKGRPAEAEVLSRQALALQRQLPNGAMTYPLLEHATNLSALGKRDEAEPLLREALAYLRSHHFAEAHPTVIDVKTRLGDVLNGKGDRAGLEALLPPVVVELDKSIAAAPHDLIARMRRANALRQLGDTEGAIAEYTQILDRKPDHPGARLARLPLYIELKQFDKAAGDCTSCIAASPANFWYFRQRGFCYAAMAQWDKAEADFVKFLELKPDALMEVGISYQDAANTMWETRGLDVIEKGYRKALAKKRQAIIAFPENPRQPLHFTAVTVTLNQILKDSNQSEEASKLRAETVAFFETMALEHPACLEHRLELARFLDKTGSADAAHAQFSKILETHPQRGDAWSGRATACRHRGQWEAAVADYSRAIELQPDVHSNWFHRGISYTDLKRWDDAAMDFDKCVASWPNDAEGWYLRARTRAAKGRNAEAVADLREAIARGLKDVGRVKTDQLFQPLLASDDFKKLLTELAGPE